MGKNAFETLMGAVVLLVAVSFLTIAYRSGQMEMGENGYTLTAKFSRADGLSLGSDVRISGLKVGSVASLNIDPATYLAIVTLNLDPDIKIPSDSSAEIVSDGLLGGKYISLVPGGAEEMLASNAEIQFTQSSINIEALIGKFMFGGAEDKKEDEKEKTALPEDSVPDPF